MPISLVVDGKAGGKIKNPRHIIEKYFSDNRSVHTRMVNEAFNEFHKSVLKRLEEETPQETEYDYRKSFNTTIKASPNSPFESVYDQQGPEDGALQAGWVADGLEAGSTTSRNVAIDIFNQVAKDDEQANMVLEIMQHGFGPHVFTPSEKNHLGIMRPQTREGFTQTRGPQQREGREPVQDLYEILNGGAQFEEELQIFEDALYSISAQIAAKLKGKNKVTRPTRTR